eukprot:scaffold18367_cov31-Tisochrysis_lutea.AAC.1
MKHARTGGRITLEEVLSWVCMGLFFLHEACSCMLVHATLHAPCKDYTQPSKQKGSKSKAA